MLQRTAASGLFDLRKDTTLVSEVRGAGVCLSLTCLSFRFTIGAAAPLEKKKTGPSQADVEAIKVRFGFSGLLAACCLLGGPTNTVYS